MPTKLTKLKLIGHFAYITLVTLKYSQSTVYTSISVCMNQEVDNYQPIHNHYTVDSSY